MEMIDAIEADFVNSDLDLESFCDLEMESLDSDLNPDKNYLGQKDLPETLSRRTFSDGPSPSDCHPKSENWWRCHRQVESFKDMCRENAMERNDRTSRKTNSLFISLSSKQAYLKELQDRPQGTKERLLNRKQDIEKSIVKARELLSESSVRVGEAEARVTNLESQINAIQIGAAKNRQKLEQVEEHIKKAVAMYQQCIGMQIVTTPSKKQMRIQFTHVERSNPSRVCSISIQGTGNPDFKIIESEPNLSGLTDELEALLNSTRDFQGFLCRVRQLFCQSMERNLQ